jgi:hypothetical protein
MTKEILRARISKKFGKMSRFASLAKIERYDLQKLFARKSPSPADIARISHLVDRTAVRLTDGDITPAQIKALYEALKNAGGVITFCNKHPQFAEKSVYQILSGRRKRMTGKVQKLFKYFKI